MNKGEAIVEVEMMGDNILVVFEDGQVARLGSEELRPFAVHLEVLGGLIENDDDTLPPGT